MALTVKQCIVNALENLKETDFHRFCDLLTEREDEPLIRRRAVEGKHTWEIANLLVSTFTDMKAGQVAIDTLRQMNCNKEADRLDKDVRALSAKTGSGSTGAGVQDASAQSASVQSGSGDGDEHFVDKHQLALIKRVSNIPPILDDLLVKKVIQQEMYDDIRKLPTTHKMMREIFSGCLKGGKSCKDIFYKSLEENERYLMDDLKNKK